MDKEDIYKQIPTTGYIGKLSFFNIPIFIHWTFPAGGLLVTLFTRDIRPSAIILIILAYTSLIIIHELGHALIAKLVSVKVHSVLITGIGGWCFADEPSTTFSRLSYSSGGIIAQVIVFILTVLFIYLIDNSTSLILGTFAFVYTFVNVLLIVIAIFPFGYTDGHRIWLILKKHFTNA